MRKIDVLRMVVMKSLTKGVRVLRRIHPLRSENGGEEVSGDEYDDSNNGKILVLREGPVVLVKTNKVVLLCHGIQIIMSHMILIMEAD